MSDDPSRSGSHIVGVNGGRYGALVDFRGAVIATGITALVVEQRADPPSPPMVGLELAGLAVGDEVALKTALYLFPPDGVAAVIVELAALLAVMATSPSSDAVLRRFAADVEAAVASRSRGS